MPYVYNALKTLRIIHPAIWRDEDVRNVHYMCVCCLPPPVPRSNHRPRPMLTRRAFAAPPFAPRSLDKPWQAPRNKPSASSADPSTQLLHGLWWDRYEEMLALMKKQEQSGWEVVDEWVKWD